MKVEAKYINVFVARFTIRKSSSRYLSQNSDSAKSPNVLFHLAIVDHFKKHTDSYIQNNSLQV